MNELALKKVQKPAEIFAFKAKRHNGTSTSAKWGVNITVVVCVSSTG